MNENECKRYYIYNYNIYIYTPVPHVFMCGIFTNIHSINHPNVGKYAWNLWDISPTICVFGCVSTCVIYHHWMVCFVLYIGGMMANSIKWHYGTRHWPINWIRGPRILGLFVPAKLWHHSDPVTSMQSQSVSNLNSGILLRLFLHVFFLFHPFHL